jgi:hypothetical protein
MMGTEHRRFWLIAAATLMLSALAAASALNGSDQPSLEELKGRVANTGIGDRPPLCLEISERQLGAAGRFYIAGDSEQAKAALTDVVTFAGLARDYSIQSHKRETKSEIAIRKMVRKLINLKHTVSHEDQGEVQSTIDRLERIQDDLLAAMFPKGGKK